jgi:hypothetical protein
MSIQVTPIPRLTTLTTPAFTLGTANAAGDAITAVASNSTLLAFDTTLPAAVGTPAVGTATVASHRDHVHAGEQAIVGSYTGDGTTSMAVTGLGITPEAVWIFANDNVANAAVFHYTTTQMLATSVKSVESTPSAQSYVQNGIIAFGSGSFTVDDNGDDGHPNKNGNVYFYIAWGT